MEGDKGVKNRIIEHGEEAPIYDPCKTMLLAVLERAILDVLPGNRVKKSDRLNAFTWLLGWESDNRDDFLSFKKICQVLGVDPKRVQGQIRLLIENETKACNSTYDAKRKYLIR